jgi:ABC-type uncharacterized transport system substrate-binding protein
MRTLRKALVSLGLALPLALPAAALAHPHVFVDARAEIQFDAQGQVTAIRNIWRFDDAFSAFATQGLDADGDGIYSKEELAPLAKVNVDSLKEFDYFTIPKLAGKRIGLKLPVDYSLSFDDGYLTLFYTLPLKQPVKPAGEGLAIEIYDPSYFVDFDLVKDDPVLATGAPKGCALTVDRKGDLDPATAAALSQIPATQRDVPSEFKSVTSSLANTIRVKCP